MLISQISGDLETKSLALQVPKPASWLRFLPKGERGQLLGQPSESPLRAQRFFAFSGYPRQKLVLGPPAIGALFNRFFFFCWEGSLLIHYRKKVPLF